MRVRGRRLDETREEFHRVRTEITDSEEQIRRLRMSGLLHLSDVDMLDQFEDELREFERATEEVPEENRLHRLHDELHGLRSRIDGFSNEIRMV